ncbi:MAG: hypothetical protein ACLQFW_14420 [Xanthobacteraceae bacterium]
MPQSRRDPVEQCQMPRLDAAISITYKFWKITAWISLLWLSSLGTSAKIGRWRGFKAKRLQSQAPSKPGVDDKNDL